MTYEEAIERLRKRICCDNECEIDKAIQAMEKQIPKELKLEWAFYDDESRYIDKAKCPSCKCEIEYEDWGMAKYCTNCGQHLDWSFEDDV